MSKSNSRVGAFLIAVGLAFTTHAGAVLPDGGWWANPAESGRGFNIEIQNNLLFMSAFVYDAQGRPLWLTSGGAMSSDRTYSGPVSYTSGGQCLGCPYTTPQYANYGSVTINFTGPTTAIISINGNAIPVQRFQFGVNLSNVATPLLGEWAFVEGSALFPVYFGDRIAFQFAKVLNGSLTATGNTAGSTGINNIAVGSYSASSGSWSILLDSSTSYYKFFRFSFMGVDRIEGTVSTFLKSDSPGAGMPFVAQRIKSAAAVAGQNAPGSAIQSVVDGGKSNTLAIGNGTGARTKEAAEAHNRTVVEMGGDVQASAEDQAEARALEAKLRDALYQRSGNVLIK